MGEPPNNAMRLTREPYGSIIVGTVLVTAGITRLSEDGMTCTFALPSPPESRRFLRVREVVPGWWSHELCVSHPTELNAEVQTWLRRSYRLMGMQARLKGRTSSPAKRAAG